jgi:hypothetical protein
MTLDEQITELTRTGSGKLMVLARPGVVALIAGLVLAGLLTGTPAFHAIALAFSIIALAVWMITPHIGNAARGLKEGIKQSGAVEISIQQWTDADANQHESYHGLISMNHQPLWQMEFAAPQNWQPVAGKYPAQLAFIPGVEWPVVILIRDGLLYPRLKPRRTSAIR